MKKFYINPQVIYGDTDSVFVNYRVKYKTSGEEYNKDNNAVALNIKLSILASLIVNKLLPYPHDLEYEKTFWRFIY